MDVRLTGRFLEMTPGDLSAFFVLERDLIRLQALTGTFALEVG